MRYMLDTNICIYLMKRQPPRVLARFAALGHGDVVMSALTLGELRFGAAVSACRAQDEAALDSLLEDVPSLPFGDAAASSYAALRAAVPDRRRDAIDRLIAAQAISLDLTLVTNDETGFAGYPGLRLENWTAER